jgi:hypothetical protein
MDMIKSEAKIPGVTYKTNELADGSIQNTFENCKYWVPKTVGFYQLRNTLATVTEPYNTYMFVSDANAPVPVYDIDISDKDDTWWDNKDNALDVANSIFMFQDSGLFDTIKDVPINGEFGKALFKCVNGKEIDESKNKFLTWGNLLKYNTDWHCANTASDALVQDADIAPIDTDESMNLYAVFQSLNNPYTSTNVVFAIRTDYTTFSQALERQRDSNYPYWNKSSSSIVKEPITWYKSS